MAAEPNRSAIFRQVKNDLAWFPGRTATTWRIAALCSLMAMFAMLYDIPESAISCYLILFVMKQDPIESMVMAVAVSILVSIVVGLIFLILPWALESVTLRMSVLVVSSFVFLWLGSASKLGPVGNIIALVIAFVMSLLGNAPDGELATRAVLYAWLMAVTPMVLLVVFNLFLGRASWKMLRFTISQRLITAASALRQPDDATMKLVRARLLDGQSKHQKRILLIRIFHLCPPSEIVWLEAAINNSYRLLLAIADPNREDLAVIHHELAEWCENTAYAVIEKYPIKSPLMASQNNCEISEAIKAFAIGDNPRELHPSGESFFVNDAFTSPIHQYFALKTTAASVICYLIYTAIDWQDIHTAMITCYVAVLGTTGETVHKLTLRIIGCLLGAVMGVFSLVFIVHVLSDIGQLMVLIFIVILLAAWISSGSERIAYAGIQLGLAFLLTVLQGFSPATDLDAAMDRVIGILLGNLVVYLIFTHIWPAAIVNSVRTHIHRALDGLVALAELPTSARTAALREASNIEEELSDAYESLKLLIFEPTLLRPSVEETIKIKSILAEIEQICPTLSVPGSATHSDIRQLRYLSSGDQEMAHDQTLVQAGSKIRQSISRLEELME
ncbi:FUSC family protein [Escherichia coli]|nr:FUSC family protein [Escherichia coli]EKY6658094.1 FUSC family protein [Escherichia coli]